MTVSVVKPVDLGDGVTITYLTGRAGTVIGMTETHLRTTRRGGRRRCPSRTIRFALPEAYERWPGEVTWEVHSWDPLTLWPSIYCESCGRHGFVFEGKWLVDE